MNPMNEIYTMISLDTFVKNDNNNSNMYFCQFKHRLKNNLSGTESWTLKLHI